MAGTLDRLGYGALVFCAIASLAARADLAILVDKLAQQIGILIVNDQFAVGAKSTVSGAKESPPLISTHSVTPTQSF